MQTPELPSLTPLRGIAAIWVICFHFGVVYFAFHPEQFSWIFNKGYLAVDMFFMLSGFVLSHVYWKSFASEEAPQAKNYWSFIGARVARLYPLHLFNLGQFLAVMLSFSLYKYISAGHFDTIPAQGARSWTALLANVLMLQGLDAKDLAWNYPAWSISIEFLAYFLFPLALPWIASSDLRRQWMIAASAFCSLCLFAFLGGGDFNQWSGPITLLRCLPEFVIGALLYTGFRNSYWPCWLKRDYAVVAIACGVLVLLHFGATDLMIIIGFPALILAAVMNAGRSAPILNSAPLVWLGEISYSLYLAHGFVQFATTRLLVSTGMQEPTKLSNFGSAVLLAAMLAGTFLIAAFTYREIEMVGRSRLRQLLSWQRKSSSENHPSRTADAATTAR